MLVDSHCHLNMLDLAPYDNKLSNVIKAAENVGVKHFLCVSVDLETFPAVLGCAKSFNNVYASAGVHPNDSEDEPISVEDLVKLADDKHVIAIGETGLDYFRSQGDLEWQRDAFRRHIQAAKMVNKPVIIHTREAADDTISIMQEESIADVGGVMHCFTETWEMAEKALNMGFYISISGIVTFKNAKQIQDVAKRVPLERLLVETDSPFLAPVPHRGKANYPEYVRHVAEYIADLRGIPLAELAQATTENFFRLFLPDSVSHL
jgi:TatD DNase family protein